MKDCQGFGEASARTFQFPGRGEELTLVLNVEKLWYPIMENQMEKKIGNEMEAGII